jgi:hypothetical protein
MRWIRAAAPIALAGLIGCGDPDDRISLVPVTGTVTLNGKPLADARVTFLPDPANKSNTPGTDSTGPNGNYKLRFKSRSGIAPGKYKVEIEPPLVMSGGVPVPEAFKDDPLMLQKAEEARNINKRGSAKKAAGSKSQFEAEVPDAGGEFDFDVKAS